MRRLPRTLLAACSLTILAGCGADPLPPREALVSEACGFDDVPPESEWTLDRYSDPPRMYVEYADGRSAEVSTQDGTTIDTLDENLRIEKVVCWVGDADDDEDIHAAVSWSPDGKTFTLDKETVYSGEEINAMKAEEGDDTSQTDTSGSDPSGGDEVEVEDDSASVTNVLGGFTDIDIEQYVVSNFSGQPGVDLDTFDCDVNESPYFAGDTATCTVQTDQGEREMYATVSEDDDGTLRITLGA